MSTQFNVYFEGAQISIFYADDGFGNLIWIENKSANHPIDVGFYDSRDADNNFLDYGY